MASRLTKNKVDVACRKAIQSGKIFYFLPLMYLSVLLFSKGLVQPSGYYRLHYLFTYDHGYISRGFVGEVMSWFFDTISDRTIQYVVLGCSIVLVISASVCFGKALNKVKLNSEYLACAFVLMLILLFMPTSFSLQFGRIHLDKFIWTLTVISVFLSGFKLGIWLVPVLCIISTIINPVYVFSSMILIAIVLLQRFYSEGFSFKTGTICFLSYAGIIIAALISVGSTHNTGFADTNEMLDFYYQRFIGEPLTDSERQVFAEEWLFEYFLPAKEILKRTFNYYFKEWGLGITTVIYFVTIVIPLTVLLSALWIRAIKNTVYKFQKFIYCLCLIAPVVIIPEIILAWEIQRYYGDCLIVQFSLLLFFFANKTEGILEAVKDMANYFKQHKMLSLIIILHFALLMVL